MKKSNYIYVFITICTLFISKMHAACLVIENSSIGEKLTVYGILDEAGSPCPEGEICPPCATPVLKADNTLYYLNGIEDSDLENMLSTSIEHIIGGDSVVISGEVFYNGDFRYINVEAIRFGTHSDENIGDEPQYDFADRWVALDISDGMESELIQISEHVYTIEKDTAIGDNTYKTLWRDGKQYIGALRTEAEGQKVYFNPNGKEYLLMDFSVQVGDTVNAWWGDYNAETECQPNWTKEHSDTIMPEWKVIDVSYVDGRKHVKVARIHKYSLGVSNEWIEGIGTVHILFPYGSSVCKEGINISFWTLCAYQDNRQLYSFDLSRYGIVNDCPDWHQIGNCLPDVHSTNSAAQKQLKDNRLVITLPDGRHFDQLGRLIKE